MADAQAHLHSYANAARNVKAGEIKRCSRGCAVNRKGELLQFGKKGSPRLELRRMTGHKKHVSNSELRRPKLVFYCDRLLLGQLLQDPWILAKTCESVQACSLKTKGIRRYIFTYAAESVG